MEGDLTARLHDDRRRLEKYITEPEGLIFDDLSKSQRHISRKPSVDRLFKLDVTQLSTTLKVSRDYSAGVLLGFHEIDTFQTEKPPLPLSSMTGTPIPSHDDIRGDSTNMPGGLSNFDDLLNLYVPVICDSLKDLETVPPGFDFGMDFNVDVDFQKTIAGHKTEKNETVSDHLDITQLMFTNIDEDDIYTDVPKLDEEIHPIKNNNQKIQIDETDDIELQKLTSNVAEIQNDVLTISSEPKVVPLRTDWAQMVDVNKPVVDFYKIVPSMAKTWPFELDVFQKQAILRLERNESVLVAAHTSAGKTVVAEYAIALSLKHMTRSIYTSPIKALSNQKFKEFKEAFDDVGLLTGDTQKNPTASCLIMTTEILRSMLYNGSDTIRDLEWVIFDEVHYINDSERGVVWEEVLIMLPQHVNIVLLSATVPNTLQFADWIGRTKQKMIYVISTPKRPVPLVHYLFVEAVPKNQDKLFVIVNADGKLNTSGYLAALEAKNNAKSKKGQQYGTKLARTSLGMKQEKNLYVDVVNMLKKKDQLPVVVFTFSRKRCDRNARALISLDLTSPSEKSHITEFIVRSTHLLKETDRNLPQVRAIRELLLCGIGIHHSGILPILKEVVEQLFQRGHVKLLFATETFAMGVNMPARTVVFDAIEKHDGIQRRFLHTAEYIQMAGRAGRRGLDTTGMVIVLCKDDVPELSELNSMMMGKSTLLVSRFRLTYSMILNLLSVDNLTVEDMMKWSFSEAENEKNRHVHQKQLDKIKQKMDTLVDIDCQICSESLEDYYNACKDYVSRCFQIRVIMSRSQNALIIGRFVLIALDSPRLSFAVILKDMKQSSLDGQQMSSFFVLTMRNTINVEEDILDKKKMESDEDTNKWPHYLNAHRYLINDPDDDCTRSFVPVITRCNFINIVVITTGMLRTDASRVLKDWERRQIPRFKDDAPSETFLSAVQELTELQKRRTDFTEFDPLKDRTLEKDIDLHDLLPLVKNLRAQLQHFVCVQCVNFEEHFLHVYQTMKLKERFLSKQLILRRSLIHQSEYESRKEVLKELKYIESSGALSLKGRVARRIGTHELMITELILDNLFSEMQPAEIAALLSCMVFQEKYCSEANLNPDLTQGMKDIMAKAEVIALVERKNGIQEGNYENRLNFNLAEVVYEWARGTSFTEIMQLTDVQEGIIVRCIQRLDEILRDLKEAAKTVGNPVLQKKMEEASLAIRKDIVFADSLYTH